jgi:hypothetical protein
LQHALRLPIRRDAGPRLAVVLLCASFAGVSFTGASALAQGGSPCAPVPEGDIVTLFQGSGSINSLDAALFADGSGIVVWAGSGTGIGDDSRLAVLARRIDVAGNPQGDRFVVNTLTEEDQFVPRVAAAPNGRFAVAWQSDVSPGDLEGTSIRARVFRSDGSALGPDFQVNSSTSGPQVAPDVAMAENGDFVVVWYDDSDAPGSSQMRGREVRARRFGADGTPLGADFVVNDITNGTQNEPAIAMAPDGRFAVAFTASSGASAGNDNNSSSVQARVFGANGVPIAGQFQVNTTIAGAQSAPAIAMDPDGSFLVAWRSATSDESDQDGDSIHARGYTSTGAAVGTQKQVNERTANDQFEVQVAAAGGREFLVVWLSREFPQAQSVQARALTLEAQPLGIEFEAGGESDIETADPGVGGNGAGRTVVLFDRGGVRAQIYDLPCVTGGGVTDCTESPTTLCLTGDRFRITTIWRDVQGDSGEGQAVELTPDTGYFWFFDSANVETLVKVLDACGFNNRFWVFVGGLTDLHIEYLVEDVETNVVRRYENPQGAAFLTINDTSAFDTCP